MKLRAIFAAVLLAAATLLPAASPVAASHTTNLAGRPYTGIGFGGSNSSCHMTIYGRVDGRMVLFGPAHCIGEEGKVITGWDGARIGVVSANINNMWAQDMAMVWLDPGDHPSSGLNTIWLGGVLHTNTYRWPSALVRCADIIAGDRQQDISKTGYWVDTVTPQGPFSGNMFGNRTVDKGGGHCIVGTNFHKDWGTHNIPSGAPLVDTTVGGGGFIGGATDAPWNGSYYGVRWTSWRQIIIDLDSYYRSPMRSGAGAFFCANSDCTY